MKFDTLRAIGHNIADSLGSGIGLMIGVYEMDVFGEARRSPERMVTVDFLNGIAAQGVVSTSLADAIAKYRSALPDLCAKHGASPTYFRTLTATYLADTFNRRIVVTVEDQHGHRSVDEYVGVPARRIKVLDSLGRVRRK